MFAAAYPGMGTEAQAELRTMFTALCNDDTPMVRRAAAKALGVGFPSMPLGFRGLADPQPFARSVAEGAKQHDNLIKDVLPLYRKLSTDDQDSVRLLTIPDLIAITSNLDAAETKEHMLESIRNAVTDKSWRVRYMVANEFVALAESVGEAIVKEELVGAFVGLLKDQEAEVRSAAASQVPGTCLFANVA